MHTSQVVPEEVTEKENLCKMKNGSDCFHNCTTN